MKSPRLLDGIWIHFESLPDPRRTLTRCDQSAHDILTIAILAILCGAEGWEDIEQFGLLREQWLRTFLTLTHGIPSEQTFRRFFARLRPKAFAECFARWVQTLIGSSDGKLINIDGKTLRRSFDHATGRTALHIVHAWCADNAMLLAQHAVDAKSNEITAIPELLKLLDLRGALVSIDAMGTQKEIANDIVRAGGDYLLALEDNHPTVHHEINDFFDRRINTGDVVSIEHVDKDHGRLEVRRVHVSDQIRWFDDRKKWRNLQAIVRVHSERTLNGTTSIEHREYLCSLPLADAQRIADATRRHWSVENTLHWSLDVTFREDDSRIRREHGPQNFALMRRLALMLLRGAKRPGRSVKQTRKGAGWSQHELLRILQVTIQPQPQDIS